MKPEEMTMEELLAFPSDPLRRMQPARSIAEIAHRVRLLEAEIQRRVELVGGDVEIKASVLHEILSGRIR